MTTTDKWARIEAAATELRGAIGTLTLAELEARVSVADTVTVIRGIKNLAAISVEEAK